MNIKITKSLEEGEQLLQHKEANEEESRLSTTIKNHHCRIKSTLCLLIANGCFLALAIFGLAPVWVPQNSKICYEKRYSLSSLWDVVQYRPAQFHLEPDMPSKFRGEPRPELDEAWANITEGHLILLSEEEMGRLGHTVEGAARQGESYIALVEVFHQIHCVDMIRKFVFREHYPDWNALQGPDQGILDHVDHCIDLLRQKIICEADVGLMAYSYDPVTRFATARTSNMHMCRDFQAIQEWAANRRWDPNQD